MISASMNPYSLLFYPMASMNIVQNLSPMKKRLWIDKGIQEAILKAKSEAELTANNSGKKLGDIISIETSHYYPSDAENAMALSAPRPGETLIDLPHFVEMSVSIRAKFELLEKKGL